ncbi:hypothetical protein [Waltera intestinalis]|uniref:O-antigen polymerase n=1 Tax=Waltera intestinalis TaxID=2606635 RepID=A0A6L5YKZ3_9FIRM|nr:hypothetical protein [Waltera intestinalis]MST58327.1 hypothetical protein [Waltera intestinalis]
MDKLRNVSQIEYVENKPELRNAKLLYILMSVLLITDWVMPQYFGIHIAFDFTCTRIMNMILMVYFIYNRKAGNHFVRSMLDVQITPYMVLYMFVMIYTTVLRVNINTFFLNFLDILTFFMVYYGIRYVIGVRKAINWTVKIAWFLGIYGVIEYALGFSPMIRILKTLPAVAGEVYRSGQYRISGPCVHPIAYGILMLFLLAVICIDYDRDELYLLKHPILYLLLLINIFLSGSRSPLGLAFIETILIILASSKERRKKTIIALFALILICAVLELALIETSIGRYIMMQITSIIDEIFGTEYSVNFGANISLLNMSSDYRDYLPRIFTVEWLNPLVGKGANAQVGFEFDGVFIKSIDNFYVATYIRYAYPGLLTFVLIQIMAVYYMLKTGLKHKSGLSIGVAFALIVYFIELWWVDYLQTTKYMYILLAIYAAHYSNCFQNCDKIEKHLKKGIAC